MENKSSAGGGVGCLTVVGIVLVVLKLTGNLGWSWLWVLSPFWGGCALGMLLLIGVGLLAWAANR